MGRRLIVQIFPSLPLFGATAKETSNVVGESGRHGVHGSIRLTFQSDFLVNDDDTPPHRHRGLGEICEVPGPALAPLLSSTFWLRPQSGQNWRYRSLFFFGSAWSLDLS
ncbi:uncharacterized protein BDZ83DRAFT_369121 [Colletotrichum acutatum]|uniref:Uncharacterized protein n=1 Tax=Glomerella acutata TaxID=27357 RepID=A0AAD8UGP7_GLOAC|nr:uncharacterized protein BDZ83DRAFT_369121 [Colletotrichum acutatum]KAK1723947.1 hypothetical protein BDZ83DRAFT_369121 [Colletotrichum acutatum]